MYLGRIVEIGPAEEVIGNPTHPYTRALVDAISSSVRVTPSVLVKLKHQRVAT